MYKKILIPVDGSEKSQAAVRKGAEMASIFGATVTLFHVVPVLTIDRFRSIIIDEAKTQGNCLNRPHPKSLNSISPWTQKWCPATLLMPSA